MSERRLRDVLKERARPHPSIEATLTRAAAAFARASLIGEAIASPADGFAQDAVYLGRSGCCA